MLLIDAIFEAIKQSNLKRIHSCCYTNLKCCNTDRWEGNLEVFAEKLLELTKDKADEH